MKELKNLQDEVIQDNNYPEGVKISDLGLVNTNFDILYNFTKNRFGYDDDARDFANDGDDFVVVEVMDVEPDGSLTIWYEEEEGE